MHSRGFFRKSDTIFPSHHLDSFFKTRLLISIQHHILKVSHYWYSDCSHVIILGMRSNYIITSSTSFINSPSLSYNIMISNISPLTRKRMISINGTKHLFITCSRIHAFCSMMKDNPIYFLYLLYRPYEKMSILISGKTHSFGSIWKVLFEEIHSRTIEIDSIELSLCLGTLYVLDIFRIFILPVGTIRISHSLIRSPIRTRDNSSISYYPRKWKSKIMPHWSCIGWIQCQILCLKRFLWMHHKTNGVGKSISNHWKSKHLLTHILPIEIETFCRYLSIITYLPIHAELVTIRKSIFFFDTDIPAIFHLIHFDVKWRNIRPAQYLNISRCYTRSFDCIIIFWFKTKSWNDDNKWNYEKNSEKVHFYLPKRKIMDRIRT